MKKHNYREDLKNRTIEPSSGSWEKLNKKLSAAENEKKRSSWKFLKIASVLLVFLSISWYFYDRQEDKINSQIIAAPSPKEDLNNIPDINQSTPSIIADNPEAKPTEKSPSPDYSDDNEETTTYPIAKAIIETHNESNPLEVHENQLAQNDIKSEDILAAEIDPYTDSMFNQEIDQLLYNSKLKLIVNGQISSKKLVNADALLNSVEDDMNKSLKEKLLEKITATLKKEREVASSKEN